MLTPHILLGAAHPFGRGITQTAPNDLKCIIVHLGDGDDKLRDLIKQALETKEPFVIDINITPHRSQQLTTKL